MKAIATLLSTMVTILAASVPLAHGQYGGAPAAPGYGPPGPAMGTSPAAAGPGPALPNPYCVPGPYGPQPTMASPYAPSGGGYPPAGGFGPPPRGYSPQQALMQTGYADASYYQGEGAPQLLPNGEAPQGAIPDDYSGFEVYGDPGQFDQMNQFDGMGTPYGGGAQAGGGDPYDVRRHRVWFQSEALLWARHKRMLPPLATTSVLGTIRQTSPFDPVASTLGFPTTTLLFGGNREGQDVKFGSMINFGFWLDPPNEIGIGGRFWILDDDHQNYVASSTSPGLENLAIPIFNVAPGFNKEDAVLIGFQGAPGPQQSGSLFIHMANEILGADAYVRMNMLHWFGQRRDGSVGLFHNWDMLVGYRFTRVNDLLTIHADVSTDLPADISFTDYFRTKNQFHGGLLGISKTLRNGRWSVKAAGNIGFGNMHQTVLIAGTNTVSAGGPPSTTPGAIFTQTTNLGKYNRDHFAYVPEFKLNFGFQVTNIFRVTAGYDFMYWSNVMMAGQQIDRSVNRNLFGGMAGLVPARPEFFYRDTDFWAQGLNFGVIGEF
jgi:hypothetical protein